MDIHGSITRRAFLDYFEGIVIVLFYTSFVWQLIRDYLETGRIITLLFVLSEGLVVLFTLIRRPAKDVTRLTSDWVLGFAGTLCPLLLRPLDAEPLVAPAICTMLVLAGLTLQIAAKLTLRRNFGIVAANRGVSTGGPYQLLRHPIYAAYALVGLGFVLSNPTLWNLSIYLVGCGLQVARMLIEERLLMKDAGYRAFAEKVRYRMIPLIF